VVVSGPFSPVALLVALAPSSDTTACNLFEPRCAYRSQPARKRMPQVVPTKVFDPRLNNRVVKPMPTVFERLARLGRLEHTPTPVALVMHNPQGGNRSII
jgi:hypothetical protein